jgi:hypothetical protein
MGTCIHIHTRAHTHTHMCVGGLSLSPASSISLSVSVSRDRQGERQARIAPASFPPASRVLLASTHHRFNGPLTHVDSREHQTFPDHLNTAARYAGHRPECVDASPRAPSLSARPLALQSIPRALRGRDATEECRWIMSLEIDGGKHVLVMTGEITFLSTVRTCDGLTNSVWL